MNLTKLCLETLDHSGVCDAKVPSFLGSPIDVAPLHDIATFVQTLEKLVQRVDALTALLDHEHESPKTVGVAGEVARALALILQKIVMVPASLPEKHTWSQDNLQRKELDSPLATEATQLTRRQRQVLHLLLEGKSNKEIARSLFLGEGTVKVHMAALFRALGVANRAGAAAAGSRLFHQRSSELRRVG